MAITTNTGAVKIEGTDSWRDIFGDHNDTVDAYDALIGNTSMGTTATTLTGAIAEHEADINGVGGINPRLGNTAMGTTATTITGAVKELNDHIANKVEKTDNGYFNNWLANNGTYATYDTKPFDIVVCHNGSRNYIFIVEAGNYSTWSVHGASMTEESLIISVASNGKTTITNNSPTGLNITIYRLNSMY